jgi:hypothetical protein
MAQHNTASAAELYYHIKFKTTLISVFTPSHPPSACQSRRHIVEQIHAGIDYGNNASLIFLEDHPAILRALRSLA